MKVPAILLVAAAAGCASFESADVVLDLRILGITSSVPEQVIDIDLQAPPPVDQLLAQLVPTEVCALVAEPDRDRAIAWSLTLCALDNNERCAEESPLVLLREGVMPDPETTPVIAAADRMCATVTPDANLLAVVQVALERADFGGVGGIDYGVSLAVVGADEPTAPALFGGKSIRLAARIPAARTANVNPTLEGFDAVIDDGAPVRLPLGRCAEQTAPLTVTAGTDVRLTPVEPAGAREVYVTPTLDGSSATFTESLTYQWLTGPGGRFSPGRSGGGRDFAGNPAPLFSDFRAPDPEDLEGPTDIPIWIIQRDERLGQAWFESCVRVVP